MKRLSILLFLGIVLFSMQLGINSALDRFDDDNLLLGGRSTYWKNTWNIYTRYPIFGIGLGTFTFMYPDWESNGTPIRLFHAHNDYLEYLTELGILGSLFFMAGMTALFVICIQQWRRSSYSSAKMIALGCGVGIANILIHSLTDFNLHIPANMLLFSIVLSLSLAGIFILRKNRPRINMRKNSTTS
jgi:O-antigen ligase